MANRKLTIDQVKVIRHLYRSGGLSVRKLADMFKVSHGQIHKIVNRKSWPTVREWISDEDVRQGVCIPDTALLPDIDPFNVKTKTIDDHVDRNKQDDKIELNNDL